MTPRLYAYIAAALLLASGAWYVHHLQGKARERDQAVSDLAAYKDKVAVREKQEADDRAEDAITRATLHETLIRVTEKLNDLQTHMPKQLVKYVQLPGDPCLRPRLDPDFVRVYNAAADASAVPDTH